jgi:hypothetical protein
LARDAPPPEISVAPDFQAASSNAATFQLAAGVVPLSR